MESGFCLNCFNCCFFNCFNSFHLSIFEIISSVIGIGLNSLVISFSKKIFEIPKFLLSVQTINISFFSAGTGISAVLTIFKKMEKLGQGCFYKFGFKITKIYSISSKLLMLINIVGFFYLISFTPFLTMEISGKGLFNDTLINHVGPGKEIEYVIKFINKTSHCKKYNCSSNETLSEEDEENKENYGDVLLILFYSLLSCIIMFFNGESFSSDSKRIQFLSSGKLSLELKPFEVATSICNRKKSFSLLNLLFCYKATLLNVKVLISVLALIILFVSIFDTILISKMPWPQLYFFDSLAFIAPFLVSLYCFLFGICWEKCCDPCKNGSSCCKKCCRIIAVIITILMFPYIIISCPILVGSQNGKIKYKAYCDLKDVYYLDHKDLYMSICNEDYKNKYLFITVRSCSIDKILIIFILGLIQIILNFYLIVLLMNYIQRATSEFGTFNRAYDAIMYLIEDNGNKICVDDIKIECKKNIYKRKIKNKKARVSKISNLPIIYSSNNNLNNKIINIRNNS